MKCSYEPFVYIHAEAKGMGDIHLFQLMEHKKFQFSLKE